MQHFKQIFCVAVVFCAGCSGSNYGRRPAPSTPPPPGATTVDFSNFVVAQYQPSATNETRAPVQVESTNFTFADDDNPNAFDSLLATSP
jgi:hypothetical protein